MQGVEHTKTKTSKHVFHFVLKPRQLFGEEDSALGVANNWLKCLITILSGKVNMLERLHILDKSNKRNKMCLKDCISWIKYPKEDNVHERLHIFVKTEEKET